MPESEHPDNVVSNFTRECFDKAEKLGLSLCLNAWSYNPLAKDPQQALVYSTAWNDNPATCETMAAVLLEEVMIQSAESRRAVEPRGFRARGEHEG